MLKPLYAVLRDWRPSQTNEIDSMVVIAGVWHSIVGDDVALNAHPQSLDKGTLQITTSSSAWSQQLTFLEPQILIALHRLPGACSVEKLRFRIGPLRHRVSPGLRLTTEFSRQPTAYRLRSVAKRCSACGVPLDKGSRCAPCAHAEHQDRLQRLERILYETPWLSYEKIVDLLGGLRRSEYEEIRIGLLRRWWEILSRAERTGRIRQDGFERRIAGSYLLLQSGLKPDSISQAAVRNLLGGHLEALLFGSASETPTLRMSGKQ